MSSLLEAFPLVVVVALSNCVKTEPVGGVPETETETDTASGSAGETTLDDATSGAPFVPCEQRDPDICDGPVDDETSCRFFPDTVVYPADSCQPIGLARSCYPQPNGGAPGCVLPPTCASSGAQSVFFQEQDNGWVYIITGSYCGFEEPVGFARCAWDGSGPDAQLTFGPPACNCAC